MKKKGIPTIMRRIFQRKTPAFIPVEATKEEIEVMESARPFTMISDSRLWACISATKYIVNNNLPGAFVECGIWRGGASLSMMKTLKIQDAENREFYLFDTFEGMTEASDMDTDSSGLTATQLLKKTKKGDGNNIWCIAGLDDVRANLATAEYPEHLLRLVKGDVAVTLDLEENLPKEIALLRLDTDWYDSTKKELDILFPRLVKGGVCIIDDYGHWTGARKAVDDYLLENKMYPMLQVSDYSGRLFLKH